MTPTNDYGEADIGVYGAIIAILLGIQVDEDHDIFPIGGDLYASESNDICSIINRLPGRVTSDCTPYTGTGSYKKTKPFEGIPYPKNL